MKHITEIIISVDFVKRKKFDKVRDHCHLTGKNRGPAQSICKINVTQKRCTLILFVFHNFIKYDCHLSFKKIVDKKNDKVNFRNTPKTNEEYVSVTYGCIKSIESYRFSSSRLNSLVLLPVISSDETLKNKKEETVEKTLNNVNGIAEEYETIKYSKKYYPEKIVKLEETLFNYMEEKDLKEIKTEVPANKWKYLSKYITYPYEHFKSIDD